MSDQKKISVRNLLWAIIVKPTWYWLITLIPAAISIFQFWGGEREQIANVPLWLWIVLSIIAFVCTVTISAYKYVQELQLDVEKDRQVSPSVNSKAESRGNAVAIGRDNYGPIYQGTSDEKKQSRPKKTSPNWNNVEFLPWNPILSSRAKCGLEIVNNKQQSINDCYAELIEIFEENDGQYFPCYGERKAELPCLLAWEISNESIYEKIEIERTKHRYLGITYPGVGVNDFVYYVIRGKNFTYGWSNEGTVIVEIEISSKISGEAPRPKRLFAKILRQGNKFTVVEITNEPPRVNEAKTKN